MYALADLRVEEVAIDFNDPCVLGKTPFNVLVEGEAGCTQVAEVAVLLLVGTY